MGGTRIQMDSKIRLLFVFEAGIIDWVYAGTPLGSKNNVTIGCCTPYSVQLVLGVQKTTNPVQS
jgi:hypothetical protein